MHKPIREAETHHALTQRLRQREARASRYQQKIRNNIWKHDSLFIRFASLLCEFDESCPNQADFDKVWKTTSSAIVWVFRPVIELIETVKFTAKNYFLKCRWTLRTTTMLSKHSTQRKEMNLSLEYCSVWLRKKQGKSGTSKWANF